MLHLAFVSSYIMFPVSIQPCIYKPVFFLFSWWILIYIIYLCYSEIFFLFSTPWWGYSCPPMLPRLTVISCNLAVGIKEEIRSNPCLPPPPPHPARPPSLYCDEGTQMFRLYSTNLAERKWGDVITYLSWYNTNCFCKDTCNIPRLSSLSPSYEPLPFCSASLFLFSLLSPPHPAPTPHISCETSINTGHISLSLLIYQAHSFHCNITSSSFMCSFLPGTDTALFSFLFFF